MIDVTVLGDIKCLIGEINFLYLISLVMLLQVLNKINRNFSFQNIFPLNTLKTASQTYNAQRKRSTA